MRFQVPSAPPVLSSATSTRSGPAEISSSKLPSGRAKVNDVGLRSPSTSTRWPSSRAAAAAEARSGRPTSTVTSGSPLRSGCSTGAG